MGNLGNLKYLYLNNNKLEGYFFIFGWSVPYDQPNVDLFLPPFTAGSIPESIGNLRNLTYLDLTNNKLEGHFSPFLGWSVPYDVRPT